MALFQGLTSCSSRAVATARCHVGVSEQAGFGSLLGALGIAAFSVRNSCTWGMHEVKQAELKQAHPILCGDACQELQGELCLDRWRERIVSRVSHLACDYACGCSR